jgi:hypothetical protein
MESREIEVATNGILSLTIRKDGAVPWWWYLDLRGQPLYHIGNNCGTCEAIFRRVRNANLPLTPQQLSKQLEIGFEMLPQDVLETVTGLLPKGRYRVELLTVTPSFVTQENRPSSISCEADYFWICRLTETRNSADYEIILPIVDHSQLSKDRIAFYKKGFENEQNPVALAFSMYDERAVRGEYGQNAFAHFLLDGHHKVMAASEMSRAISLLSFTRLNSYAETMG